MWSEEEFQVTFKNALKWAKGIMAFLIFSKHTQTDVNDLENCGKESWLRYVRKENKKNRIDQTEHAVAHVSEIFESWKEEQAAVLSQIAKLKPELKFDEIKQYSKRSCLILTGVKESQEETTDKILLDIFLNNLGVRLDLSETDRSHRLEEDGKITSRSIIIKFISYRSRQKVFKVKMKLKDSGYFVFENLTNRRSSLMTDVKKIAGFRRVWTVDGNIFTFDRNGKIFNVKTYEDLKRVKPEEDTGEEHLYK